MNPTGNALMARSTSMMPNKLGLGAILAMIFAPKVEMRIDKGQDRYTGCLTGMNQIEINPGTYPQGKFWCDLCDDGKNTPGL